MSLANASSKIGRSWWMTIHLSLKLSRSMATQDQKHYTMKKKWNQCESVPSLITCLQYRIRCHGTAQTPPHLHQMAGNGVASCLDQWNKHHQELLGHPLTNQQLDRGIVLRRRCRFYSIPLRSAAIAAVDSCTHFWIAAWYRLQRAAMAGHGNTRVKLWLYQVSPSRLIPTNDALPYYSIHSPK